MPEEATDDAVEAATEAATPGVSEAATDGASFTLSESRRHTTIHWWLEVHGDRGGETQQPIGGLRCMVLMKGAATCGHAEASTEAGAATESYHG